MEDPAPAATDGREGPAVVATLCEGDVHHGLAALINSLYTAGFKGRLICGFRGSLPPWAHGTASFAPWPGCTVSFARLATTRHFTFYKPHFVDLIWTELAPEAESIVFVDPDIVVLCPWEFVDFWVDQGVALVEDMGKAGMSSRNPVRLAWSVFLAEHGIPTRNAVERYYNAGFVGIHKRHRPFVALWRTCVDAVYDGGVIREGDLPGGDGTSGAASAPPASRRVLAAMAIDYLYDQDGLNMAVMATDEPISDVGPEGMGFVPGVRIMGHAVGRRKPWNKNPLLDLARTGRPPTDADLAYWDNADGLIKTHAAGHVRRRRTELRIARVAGRFAAY